MIKIKCPYCGKRYRTAERFFDRQLQCKKCNKKFIISLKLKEKSISPKKEFFIQEETIEDFQKQENFILDNDPIANEKELSQNSLFLHYKIECKIGYGGMGVVYKAFDTKLERTVALKLILHEEKDKVDRFIREAQSLGQLNHPNIINIYDVGHEPRYYFTMEYIEGQKISDHINNNKLNTKNITIIFKELAKALHVIHTHKIIHRDIKPSNIMITKDNVPKILDFGLVKISDSSLSQTGELLGTPVYMSPEQLHCEEVDVRSDVYSLGTTLYEAITKRPIFEGESYFNILHQILNREPIPPRQLNPDLSLELEAICLKSIEKNPKERYQNAQVFAEDLENFLENKSIIARSPTIFSYTRKFIMRHKITVFSITILLLFSLMSLYLERKNTIRARQLAENEKEKVTIEKHNALKVLGKISFNLAQKSYSEEKDWRKSGVLAGMTLEFIKKSPNNLEINELRESAEELVWLSLLRYGAVWVGYNHLRKINNVSFSSSGKYILSSSSQEKIRLWDAKNGQEKMVRDGDGKAIFSPNEQFMVIASGKTIKLWDFERSIVIANFIGHKDKVVSLDFSPDGKYLVSGSRDFTIGLWRLDGTSLGFFRAHKRVVKDVKFSPNGKYVASASFDHEVKLWIVDYNQEKLILHKHFSGHSNLVYKVDFSPDGKSLFSSSDDGAVKQWDVENGTLINPNIFDNVNSLNLFPVNIDYLQEKNHVFRGSTCINYSSQRDLLAVSSWDSIIRIIDLPNYNLRTINGHQQSILSVAFSPDSKTLSSISFDQRIKVWNMETMNICDFINGSPILSRNGERLLIRSGNSIIVLDTSTGKIFKSFPTKWGTTAFSPDNKTVAFLLEPTNTDEKKFSNILFWNIEDEKELKNFAKTDVIKRLYFNTDGTMLACSYRTKEMVTIFHVENRNIYREFPATTGTEISFSYDNRLIAITSKKIKKIIEIWDIESQQIKQKFTSDSRFMDMIFHPRENMLAACSEKNIYLWDISTGKLLKKFTDNKTSITKICFSNSGKLIASALWDGTIQVWDIESGECTQKFRAHLNVIGDIFFDPQDTILISRAISESIKLWDIKTGKRILKMPINISSKELCKQNRIRTDIPYSLLEKYLEEQPQKIAEYLFEVKVDNKLNISDMDIKEAREFNTILKQKELKK